VVSVKDVAIQAGVSPSTVSRVMNGTFPVDEKTKRKVLETVEKMHYKPNLLARGLRNRTGKLLGLMVPHIVHETFATFISYVEKACVARGYTVILGNTRENPQVEEQILAKFIGLNVDGIIVFQASDGSSVIKNFKDRGIPVVGIDRALQEEEADHVIVGNREAGQMAAKYLYSMGHVSVACIEGPAPVRLSRERFEGFKEYYSSKGQDVVSIRAKNFEFEEGITAVRSLLEQGKEFTGLWAQDDLLAIGAMHELKRLGIRIPEDISVMGMDDIKTCRMVFPALTTIRQPYEEICEKALDLLINRIKDPVLPISRFTLPPSLVIRDSVKRI